MILALSFLFIMLMAFSVSSMIKVLQVEKGEKFTVLHMLGLTIFISFLQLLNLHSKSSDFSSILLSLYMASLLWLFAFMARFVQIYTRVYKHLKLINICVLSVGVFDTVILLTNRLHHLVFTIEPLSMWGITAYTVTPSGFFYGLHFVFGLIMALLVTYPLAYSVFGSKSLFSRKKFAPIFTAVAVSFAAAIYVTLYSIPFDVGVICYTVAVNAMCYLHYKGVPALLRNEASRMVLKESEVGIFVFDPDFNRIYINEYGNYIEEIYDINDELESSLNRIAVSADNHIRINKVRIKSGEARRIFDVGCSKLMADENLAGYVIQFFDVTEVVTAQDKFVYSVTHDELTGLFNSSFFYKNVKEYIKNHPADSYVMLVSDIRGFKFYNDIFGRDKGNQVLIFIAQLMLDNCTENSVYGRISDDEFALFMDKKYYDEDMISSYIDLMRRDFGNSQYRININIGVYDVYNASENVEAMCDKAKLAISHIKDDFSKMLAHYESYMADEIIEKQWIIEELDEALKDGQICIYLQPQVEVASGKWLGAEALVRWIHPSRGLISPASFIPVLEDYALITKVDMIVWEQAASLLSMWKKAGFGDRYISVNVSGQDFYHVDLYQVFIDLVKKYDISPGNLKIEITETIMGQSMNEKNNILRQLRQEGFIIEVDDFGSGYSSLNTLKDLEADVIKIDMGFLGATENTDRSRIIFNDVVGMIKNIDLGIVVEGVESAEQRDFVENAGCSCIQGYYYSKPITVEEFESNVTK